MSIQVFIQNEAGSDLKNHYNEKTLEYKFTKRVARAYPYPYGFIIGTTAEDGDNLDCFVITGRRLHTGQIVECEPIGLMEQVEDGQNDHNVLAVLVGEDALITENVEAALTDSVLNVFGHVEGKRMRVGRFLSRIEVEAHISGHRDRR